jgi:heme exporter protein C
MEERLVRIYPYFGIASLPAIAVWAYLIHQAPLEKTLGIVHKILYVHVPCAIPAYVGFILAAIGGIGYLRTRQDHWDRLAVASAEVGSVFCSLMVVTGMLWAKPAWGVWWVWEPRLTLTAVLWFIYIAYLFLRSFAMGSDSARTTAAIQAIVGTLVIPFVFFSVDLAGGRTMHPTREAMPMEFLLPLLMGCVSFSLAFVFLLGQRLVVARLEERLLEREFA